MLASIIEFSLRQRVIVIVGAILILFLGLIVLSTLQWTLSRIFRPLKLKSF